MKLKIIAFFLVVCQVAQAKIWQVGPTRTYTYCDKVVNLVQNGDTVQIDAATYSNVPQVIWRKANLYLVGVGGRPILKAGATIANDNVNGKGIFVISAANVKVENIEFANAAVIDNNGAGIRQEGANLWVTKCRFIANEMGILCGNIANCKTTVEFCEFFNGGSAKNPGYQHNIYINHIDTLVFRYNYSHDAIAQGHEFKSRATYNFILYNRIANEVSEDSRTIDIPNGGTSVIIGNVIEQGENSANTNLLGYGLEGLTNAAPHCLWVVNNTFINKKNKGSFIHIQANTDTLFVKNNIFAGANTSGILVGTAKFTDNTNNLIDDNIANIGFVKPEKFDYHLIASSKARDAGVLINKKIKDYQLQVKLMYKDTCQFEQRTLSGTIDIGAFEYATSVTTNDLNVAPILLYPNPTSGLLFLKNHDEQAAFILYNIEEKLVKRGVVQDNSIDISNENSGLYLLKTNQHIFKIIKD